MTFSDLEIFDEEIADLENKLSGMNLDYAFEVRLVSETCVDVSDRQ